MRAWATAVLVGVLLAAGCDGGGLSSAPAELAPVARQVDFGEAYVGAKRRAEVVLQAVGAAPVSVEASLEGAGAFHLAEAPDRVPAGGRAPVGVVFAPEAAGEHAAVLHLRTGAANLPEASVALRGVALAALDCEDDNPCTEDRFDADAGRCVNTARTGPCDDGNACTTGDTCREGLCTGAATACDDENACTRDLCDAQLGCVHVERACDDGRFCTADRCDPDAGCVSDPRPEGTPCPGVWEECVQAAVCREGRCTAAPARDGASCDDSDPCTVLDTCTGGSCRGTAVERTPELLGEAPVVSGTIQKIEGGFLVRTSGSYGGRELLSRFRATPGPLERLWTVAVPEDAHSVRAGSGEYGRIRIGDAHHVVRWAEGGPVFSGVLPFDLCPEDAAAPFAVVADHFWLMTDTGGACVYDLADFAAPAFAAHLPGNVDQVTTNPDGYPGAAVLAEGGRVWLATLGGTRIYDASDPSAPALLAELPASTCLEHDPSRGHVWMGEVIFDEQGLDHEFHVVRYALGPVPEERARRLAPRPVWSLHPLRQVLAVSDEVETRLMVPDSLENALYNAGIPRTLDADGDLLISLGREVWDLSEPASPRRVANAMYHPELVSGDYVLGSRNEIGRLVRTPVAALMAVVHPELGSPPGQLMRTARGPIGVSQTAVRRLDLTAPARPRFVSAAPLPEPVQLAGLGRWGLPVQPVWPAITYRRSPPWSWYALAEPDRPQNLGRVWLPASGTRLAGSLGETLVTLEPLGRDVEVLGTWRLSVPGGGSAVEPTRTGSLMLVATSRRKVHFDPLSRTAAVQGHGGELLLVGLDENGAPQVVAAGETAVSGSGRWVATDGTSVIECRDNGASNLQRFTPTAEGVLQPGTPLVLPESYAKLVHQRAGVLTVQTGGRLQFVDLRPDPPVVIGALPFAPPVDSAVAVGDYLVVGHAQGAAVLRPACPAP